MLEINYSVPVGPRFLDTYLFSTLAQTRFSPRFGALPEAVKRCLILCSPNPNTPVIQHKASCCGLNKQTSRSNSAVKGGGKLRLLID